VQQIIRVFPTDIARVFFRESSFINKFVTNRAVAQLCVRVLMPVTDAVEIQTLFSPVIKLGTGWVFKSQERKKERCGGFLYCTKKETKDPSDSGSRIL